MKDHGTAWEAESPLELMSQLASQPPSDSEISLGYPGNVKAAKVLIEQGYAVLLRETGRGIEIAFTDLGKAYINLVRAA